MRKPCAAALGFFDGVHAAHMRVLRAAASYAAAHGMEPVAVTFDRSPKAFVTGVDTPLICTAQERARIMREEAGMARVVSLPFDETMRDMPARAFVEEIVLGSLGAGYCAAAAPETRRCCKGFVRRMAFRARFWAVFRTGAGKSVRRGSAP